MRFVEGLTNLKAVMRHFEIQNKALAKALNVDPAQISRWMNGKRELKVASEVMGPLADCILSRNLTSKDIGWLKKAFAGDGFDPEFETFAQFKRTLILWLASDGAEFKRQFWEHLEGNSGNQASDINCGEYRQRGFSSAERIFSSDYSVIAGGLDITLKLEKIFAAVETGGSVDICLSSENNTLITNEAIVRVIFAAVTERNIHVRCLLSISGNSTALSRIMNTYMRPIVKAGMEVAVLHGIAEPVFSQMSVIVPGVCVAVISEVRDSCAPAAAMFVTEENFVESALAGFERTFHYAQPIAASYSSSYAKSILDIFYQEFAELGNLDIVTDCINVMYMSQNAFKAFLKTCGRSGDVLLRRGNEFNRFKSGMDENLRSGAVFREIVSLERLERIAAEKCCRMPGIYFLEKGILELDAAGCAGVLEGYIDYLKNFSNFNLMIADGITAINTDSCWHLKQNRHMSINVWDKQEPALIYSDQLILTHEFQTHFNNLWMRESYSLGVRDKTIETLESILAKLRGGR
jgi:transcriptional regulator with XRE-family HTH domain